MNALEILIAVWTAVLTLVATYVVVKQYQLEKTKIKFEHFERRYNLYKKVMDYIASVVREAATTTQEMFEFRNETIDVSIFFGDEIKKYVDDMFAKANRVRYLTDITSKNNLEQEAHVKFVEELHDLITWFGKQITVCQVEFSKYLRIDVDIFNKTYKKH